MADEVVIKMESESVSPKNELDDVFHSLDDFLKGLEKYYNSMQCSLDKQVEISLILKDFEDYVMIITSVPLPGVQYGPIGYRQMLKYDIPKNVKIIDVLDYVVKVFKVESIRTTPPIGVSEAIIDVIRHRYINVVWD